MDEKEKMLERVRGLLAKAEATEFEEEADALTAKAAELMARYSIDAALLAAKADVREVPCDKKIRFDENYGRQHMFLYTVILRAFGGEAIMTRKPTRGRRNNIDYYELHVFGFEANLMAVDVLYTSLYQQGVTRSKRVPQFEHAKTWRTSFWNGFINVVGERLTAANAETVSTKAAGTDIVLRDRAVEVKAKMNDQYGKTSTYRGGSTNSAAGYNAGQDAARRANLHNNGNVGQRSKTPIG